VQVRVLVVEDHVALANRIGEGLRDAGLAVDVVYDGASALESTTSTDYDVIVLDRDLPAVHGDRVCRALVRDGSPSRILMLTAAADVEDRVDGLELGADDYLGKPFAFTELLARLEALTRRGGNSETRLKVADLEMDLIARSVTRAGQAIDLLPREFRLLEYLMRHAGQVVTRTMLLENVWDYHFDPQTNVIDVHISRLRSKIDKGFAQPLLHTVRGAGYMIREGTR